MLRPLVDVRTSEGNRTRIDVKRSGYRIEQGGFPRAVRTDDDYKRSIIHRQVDRLQCAHFVRRSRIEGFADRADFKHEMTGA